MNITIGWLYPELMSTYGDIGNIRCLVKRCQWRNIAVGVIHLDLNDWKEWDSIDFLFMGGAQDRQQSIVSEDLMKNAKKKAKMIREKVESDVPGLFICGAYQFMGNYYKAADGSKLPGLGLFDLFTKHPGLQEKRLIGNIVTKSQLFESSLVGFENHGGRTYLNDSVRPFATVKKGYGNNGRDKTEGAIFHKAIGTYLHGPILPKNPALADWFITGALETKYKKPVKLAKLDDTMETKTHDFMTEKL